MIQLYGKSVVSIVLCYCLYYVAGIMALLRGGGGGLLAVYMLYKY